MNLRRNVFLLTTIIGASVLSVSPVCAQDEKTGEPGLWGARWDGNVNAGATVESGNSDSMAIDADARLTGRWDKHRTEWRADYNYEEDNDDVTVDDRSLNGAYDYFFAEKWFWNNQAGFEQDDVEKLDLRVDASTGLGYQVFERDDLELKMIAGPGYLYSEYENGREESDVSANWSLDYRQKFYEDFFRLFHRHELTAPVDDMDAFLFESESGVRLPLKRGIIASAQVDYDWNNDPAPGTGEEDTTYSLKLGYEW